MCIFNVAATTESYTYCHTRSLHDALPIFVPRGNGLHRLAGAAVSQPRIHRAGTAGCQGVRSRVSQWGRDNDDRTHERFRSEEHTSELQSLMRISFAVVCLEKKNMT